MKIESLFYFVQQPRKLSNRLIQFCFIKSEIKTTDELFYALNEQLKFPVFGWNWDALIDALCNFENIKKRNIVIMHEVIHIQNKVLDDYVLCLMTAALTWKKYSNEHRFFPIFSIKDKEKIRQILYSDNIQKWFEIFCKNLHLAM